MNSGDLVASHRGVEAGHLRSYTDLNLKVTLIWRWRVAATFTFSVLDSSHLVNFQKREGSPRRERGARIQLPHVHR